MRYTENMMVEEFRTGAHWGQESLGTLLGRKENRKIRPALEVQLGVQEEEKIAM